MAGLELNVSISKPSRSPPSAQMPRPESTAADSRVYHEVTESHSIPTKMEDGNGHLKLHGDDDFGSRPSSSGSNHPFMSSVEADREILARNEVPATADADVDNLKVTVRTFQKPFIPIEDSGQGFTFGKPSMRQSSGTAVAHGQALRDSKHVNEPLPSTLDDTVDDSGYNSGEGTAQQRGTVVNQGHTSSTGSAVFNDVSSAMKNVPMHVDAAPSHDPKPSRRHDEDMRAKPDAPQQQTMQASATAEKVGPPTIITAVPPKSRLSLANVTFLKKKPKSGRPLKKKARPSTVQDAPGPINLPDDAMEDIVDPINLQCDAMQPSAPNITLPQAKGVMSGAEDTGMIRHSSGPQSGQLRIPDAISVPAASIDDGLSTSVAKGQVAPMVSHESKVPSYTPAPNLGVSSYPPGPAEDLTGQNGKSLHDFHSSPPLNSAHALNEPSFSLPSARTATRPTREVSPASHTASARRSREPVEALLHSVSERLGTARVSKGAYRDKTGAQPSIDCSEIAEMVQSLIDKATRDIVEKAAQHSEMQTAELQKLSEVNEATKLLLETNERQRTALQTKLETFSGKAEKLTKFMNGLGNDITKLGRFRTQINSVIAEAGTKTSRDETVRDVKQRQRSIEQKLHGIEREGLAVAKELSEENQRLLQKLSAMTGELTSEKDRVAVLQRALEKPREEYAKLQGIIETLGGKTDEKFAALGELVCQSQQGSGLREIVDRCSTDVQGISRQFQTASERLAEVKGLVEALSPAMQKHFEEARQATENQPNQNSEMENRVVDLVQAMKSDIKVQEDLIAKKASLEGDIARLEGLLEASKAAISELHQKVADHESQCLSSRQRITELETNNASLILQHGSATELLQARLQESTATNAALKEKLEKLEREQPLQAANTESMNRELDETRRERDAAQQSLAESHAQLDNLRNMPDLEVEKQQLIETHKHELKAAAEGVRKQAEATRIAAAGEISRAVKQRELVEKKLVGTGSELIKLRSAFQELQKKISELNGQSESHQRAAIAADAFKQHAEPTMLKQNSEIVKLREDLRLVKESLEQVQASKTVLENAVLQVRSQSAGSAKERRKVDRRNDLPRQSAVQVPESEQDVAETQFEEGSMLDDGVSEFRPSQETSYDENAIRSQILDQDGIRIAGSQSQPTTEETQSQLQQRSQYQHNSAGSQSLDTQSPSGLAGATGHLTSPLSNHSDDFRDGFPSIVPDSYEGRDVSWSQDGPQSNMRGTQGGDMSPPPLPRRVTFGQGKKRDPVVSTPTTPASKTKETKATHSGKGPKSRAETDDADVYDGPSSPAQTSKRKATSQFSAADLLSSKKTRTMPSQSSTRGKSSSSAQHKSPNVRVSSGTGAGPSKKRRGGKSSAMDDRFSQN